MIMARIRGRVPKFVAAGDFAVHPYIVMERLAGKSLLPRLRNMPLPYEEVAEIGWKVATALEDLHRQHVIHLDIKPSNILFRPTGEAVLVELGIAPPELPDLMQRNSGFLAALTWRRSSFWASATIRAAISWSWRSSLFLFDRRTPVRRKRAPERHEKAALARSQATKGLAARVSAMAARDRAALPRSGAGMALSRGGATCFRAQQPQPDQADSQVQAAEARIPSSPS